MMEMFYGTGLRRRALFVSVNLALCAMAFSLLVMPTYGLFSDRDNRIADQRKVLARLSAITAQAENVRAIVSDTSAQMRGGEFLAGPNENVISADLQTKLKTLTEAAGARSRALQALPIKTSDLIRYSGSRIELVGSLPSIRRAIYAIEGAKPYLFVSDATLRVLPSQSKPGSPEEPVIQAQLDIFGAIQVNGP
jgi:general secretion pathway protein M